MSDFQKKQKKHRRSSEPSKFARWMQLPQFLRRSKRRRGKKTQSFAARLVQFIRLPIKLMAQALWAVLFPIVVVCRWLLSSRNRRQVKHLIQGLPALAAFVAVVLFGLIVHASRYKLPSVYLDDAVDAIRDEDFQAARVYFERAIDLEGPSDPLQHDLAIALAASGEHDRAIAIMTELAPLDRSGYGLAHRWLADRFVQDPKTFQSADLTKIALWHLEQTKVQIGGDANLDLNLARCCVALNAMDTAINHLQRLVARGPHHHGYYFELFRVHAAMNEFERARAALRKADAYYRKVVELNPADDAARMRWATIRASSGDFDDAVRILREGMSTSPSGEFGTPLANVFVAQFDLNESRKNADLAGQLLLLREALKHDPNHIPALSRLSSFGVGSQDQQVREILEQLLAKGEGPAFVHFALGARAWVTGDKQLAQFHFQRAYSQDDRFANIGNNLAWVLAHQETPDLDRALALINSVLDRWPENPAFRDTRGQIFVKLERWEEALDDLEFALPHLPKIKSLHESLARVYSNLGQHSLANKHIKLSEDLPNVDYLENPLMVGRFRL